MERRARSAQGPGTVVGFLLCAAWLVIVIRTDALSAAAPAMPEGVAALARLAPGLDPSVLALALRASTCAARHGLVASLGVLTIIDYSRPSNEPRLWVLDLTRRMLLYRELVAHGRGSGELQAIRFSNEAGSQQSSLGLFVTAETYDGRHGRSLRLHGLELGINDRAFERALVVHGADYVSAEFATRQGRLGRSHGCPALRREAAPPVLDTIRDGTPIFVYYPEATWLETSRFLGDVRRGRHVTVADPVNGERRLTVAHAGHECPESEAREVTRQPVRERNRSTRARPSSRFSI